MKTSDSIDKIAAALVAVQFKLDPIVKDSQNPHFKNSYASLDAIVAYVRPILAEAGLAVVQGGEESGDGVTVTSMLVHTSGQWISSAYRMPLEKGTAQSAGSAITYGRRYGISALLSLATEEDDDAHAASAPRTTAAGAPPPASSGLGNRTAEAPAPRNSDEESCPKCGGRMWDNRLTKKNPKQPDFKCRDRGCDGVIWPPRDGEKKKETVPARGFEDFPAALEDQPDDLPF